jgi:hypothetical protein
MANKVSHVVTFAPVRSYTAPKVTPNEIQVMKRRADRIRKRVGMNCSFPGARSPATSVKRESTNEAPALN